MMTTNIWPDTDWHAETVRSPQALVDLARKSIEDRDLPPNALEEDLAAQPAPIFEQLQLRDVELATEESLTAALAAHVSGDRDLAVLHLVAALESTARADALEQKESI